jgi:hypothetical protein
MTVGFLSTELSIGIYKPLIDISAPLYTPKGRFIVELRNTVEAYSHTINVSMGYDSAKIEFNTTPQVLDDWLADGLNRHVVVFGPEQLVVWEGFVNELDANTGSLSITRGPVMDITNRVSVVYSRLFEDNAPEPGGGKWQTIIVEDAASQAKWGIFETVYSIGEATLESAEQIRDLFLEENREPPTSQEISLGSTDTPSITLNCLGYGHRLSRYIYEDISALTATLQTRMIDALTADPNGLWGAGGDYSGIEANALLIAAREDEENEALSVIKWLVNHGDVNLNRFIFGVYQDHKAFYKQIPSAYEYQYNPQNPYNRIENMFGREVKPWNVLPGKWLLVSGGFMAGYSSQADLRLDPRAMFIEEVSFESPYDVGLNGSRYSGVEARLNQLGLGSI